MRKLNGLIAGILAAGMSSINQAATLGEARVQSYLSQPLDVRIPLARSSDEPLDEIRVKLAPPSFYREAGLPLEALAGNLTFRIASRGDREFVVIGSKHPIRDPILSILLEVDSPKGRMIREYDLLLDPPSVAASSVSPDTAGGSEQPVAAPGPRPGAESTEWQRVEPAREVSFDATREVQAGDTLYEIARDYVDDDADPRPMMQAIIDANPEAFVNGNGNALVAGARLKVPGKASADTETAETSAAGAQEGGAEDGAVSGTRLPALELLGPENEGAEPVAAPPVEAGGSAGPSREPPGAALADRRQVSAEGVERQAALDREELESVRAENEALTEQLRALKDQIESVKETIDARDARIAELQETVQRSRAELARAEQVSANFWVQWGKYLSGVLGLIVIALLIALGLRRGRRDPGPASLMPVTGYAADHRDADHREREPGVDSTSSAAIAAGAAAVDARSGDGAVSADAWEEPADAPAAGVDDPMNPAMALEEARVLESFNLTRQAVELLEDSLAEHPDHPGLQSALERLGGIADTEAPEAAEVPPARTPSAEPNAAEGSPVEAEDSPVEQKPLNGESDAPDAKVPESSDESHPAEAGDHEGVFDWNETDDMLATPEAESTPIEDEPSMDFDDSFALETPGAVGDDDEPPGDSGDSGRDAPSELELDESSELELPEGEARPAGIEDRGGETEAPPLDLDLSGYEPAGETEKPEPGQGEEAELDLDLGEPPASDRPADGEEPIESEDAAAAEDALTDTEADIDTRVSLAEAFLDVGDRESFDMIESELREEGATAALDRLQAIKSRADTD